MSKKIIRSFVTALGLLSRGRFEEKCNEHLAKAIDALEACPDEKGKATIQLTLELSFVQGRVDIKPSVKTKLPEEKGFSGTPFWTLESGLSVEHPSQLDMFAGPRSVDTPGAAGASA